VTVHLIHNTHASKKKKKNQETFMPFMHAAPPDSLTDTAIIVLKIQILFTLSVMWL
jgi:hypothetical protein